MCISDIVCGVDNRRAVNHLASGGRVANLSVATDESYLNKSRVS